MTQIKRQGKYEAGTSIDPESDRKGNLIEVDNEFLGQSLSISQSSLEEGTIEYGVEIFQKEYS